VEVSKARGEFIDATAAKALIGPLGTAWLARQRHLKPSSYRPLESPGETTFCQLGAMAQ
jgi:hypothetical protein